MTLIPLWVKAAVFIFLALPITFISWHAYKKGPLLGVSRFVSYLLAVLLLPLSLDYFFSRPGSPLQLLSWLLLAASLFLAAAGIGQFFKNQETRFGVDDTSKLIVSGVFKYLRHPLYASVLYLAWGLFLKHPTWLGAYFAAIASFFLVVQARLEEKDLVAQFGDDYREYMKKVKGFLPGVF